MEKIPSCNEKYLLKLGDVWSNKIAITNWSIGGATNMDIFYSNLATTYQNEVINPSADKNGVQKASSKVGLMYASDYGYAASQVNWSKTLLNYNDDTNRNDNWLFIGAREWTITAGSNYPDSSYFIVETGEVGSVTVNTTHVIRPVIFINSDSTFTGGTGTETDPYRIGV